MPLPYLVEPNDIVNILHHSNGSLSVVLNGIVINASCDKYIR